MTTSDPDSGDPPIDDPDWIKGLVAKALLQAAEDDPESAEPVEPVPRSTVRPDTEEATTPDRTVEREPGAAGSAPAGVTPPPAERDGSPATPLVIGRGLDDAPLMPSSAGSSTGSGSALGSVTPPSSPSGPADRQPTPTPKPSGTTAIEDSPPFESTVLTAEPVHPDSDEPAGNESRDHVMVEEDATIEGFRSSDIRTVLEWLAVIVSALVVALIIKAFVLQAFWIPSESMESTVNKGDRILVNKLSYRLHDIRRGDLVVFKKLPGTPGDTEDLIKRAIALPGETIEVRDDGRIWIWGPGETPEDALQLQEPYLDPQNGQLPVPSSTDSLSTDIWDDACVNQPRTPGRCTLAPDQYFMMGDNRTSSSDSRFFGPVPEDLVVGRAFLRIWPLGELSSL